jgi:hypothetical protein
VAYENRAEVQTDARFVHTGSQLAHAGSAVHVRSAEYCRDITQPVYDCDFFLRR